MQCQVETAFANINFQLDSVGNFFSALNSDIIWERFFWVMVLVLSVFFISHSDIHRSQPPVDNSFFPQPWFYNFLLSSERGSKTASCPFPQSLKSELTHCS